MRFWIFVFTLFTLSVCCIDNDEKDIVPKFTRIIIDQVGGKYNIYVEGLEPHRYNRIEIKIDEESKIETDTFFLSSSTMKQDFNLSIIAVSGRDVDSYKCRMGFEDGNVTISDGDGKSIIKRFPHITILERR